MNMTTWTAAQREKANLGLHAVAQAKKRLISAHREEYNQLHREERVARGLPAMTHGKYNSPQQIAAQIERAEEKLARLRGEFAAVSNGNSPH